MSLSNLTILPQGVVFVTGGARGLGNAVACAFAREGCAVVIADVLPDEDMEHGKSEVVKHTQKVCTET